MMTCYRMLIKKNLETQNLTILYDIVLKRCMNNLWKKNQWKQSSNFEVFVSLQEVEGSLVIMGYLKEDKILKGEAKFV